MDHTVIYQSGGSANFQWNRTALRGTYEAMAVEAAKIQVGGRRAYVKTVRELDLIGMPDTYRELTLGEIHQSERNLNAWGAEAARP